MNIDDTTNLVDGGDTSSDIDTSDAGVEEAQDEPQLDEDGNPIEEEPAEDEEEVDIDGHKVKLPKSKAEKLAAERLMQADYTRKTQALADDRKAFEAERDTVRQAGTQELQAHANIVAIDAQLARYQQIDWNQWNDADPFEAQKAFQQYQLLKDARTQTQSYLGGLVQQRTEAERQAAASRLQEGAAELAKDIKDWSPAHAAKLMEHGMKRFGFSKEDLDGIDDPRLIKVLDAAYRWDESQAKQKKAQTAQKQQEVQPAAKIGGGRAAIPTTALDDRLSADEWIKRRNAQLRKRA